MSCNTTLPTCEGSVPRITDQHASARRKMSKYGCISSQAEGYILLDPGNHLQGEHGDLVPSCPAPLEPKPPAPPPRTARITNAITTPENP